MTHTVLLPHVSREHPDLRARQWAWGVLRRNHVRDDVIQRIMAGAEWTVEDWQHTTGGGLCYWAEPNEHIRIKLRGVQEEACVHEFAHAFRVRAIGEGTWFGDQVVLGMLAEAEKPPNEYMRIRQLCREYKDGVGDWPGMYDEAQQRWNDSEIWAGLASGSMGDLSMYPPSLRLLYGQLFA